MQLLGSVPGGASGKGPTCNAGGIKRFNPWVGKILWRRAWQSTLVVLLGESPWTEEPGGLQSIGCKKLDMTKAT